MMPKPRLVLHIGTEKTGTTSIQSFAFANAALLEEQHGILYPCGIGNQFGHTKIALLGYDNSRIDDLTAANDFNDSTSRARLSDLWKHELTEGCKGTSCHTVLLSSEHFQSRLTEIEDLERLRGVLDPLFSSIEIVMFARHPISCSISLMSEAIKQGAPAVTMLSAKNPYIHNISNHKLSVELWNKVFPDSIIAVKPFNKQSFLRGSVIHDFFDCVGVLDFEGFVFPEKQNESLSLEAMYILSRLNRVVPKIVAGKVNPTRPKLLKYIYRHFSTGNKFSPSPEEIISYHQVFEESMRWIADKYWNGRMENWGSLPHWEVDDHQNCIKMLESFEDNALISSFIDCLAEIWLERSGSPK